VNVHVNVNLNDGGLKAVHVQVHVQVHVDS